MNVSGSLKLLFSAVFSWCLAWIYSTVSNIIYFFWCLGQQIQCYLFVLNKQNIVLVFRDLHCLSLGYITLCQILFICKLVKMIIFQLCWYMSSIQKDLWVWFFSCNYLYSHNPPSGKQISLHRTAWICSWNSLSMFL